ncbi:hypothetical protein T05_7981 [Trichinella murrelli]|uniref:Uncharacterized protein n=1 Tax=Trichinella murrelli TaxID=144512 RepID=A0A0V0TQ38_9BILA|nr:hypothetical protein T05_7981 [Trichinella murrelli]
MEQRKCENTDDTKQNKRREETENMKKPRTSVTKCMTLRLLYTSSLTVFLNGN